MTQELSTEVITHKLKIRGQEVRYITKLLAESLYKQLENESKQTVTIKNSKTLTFMTKYKTEVEILPLDKEEGNIEDILYTAWLNELQKNQVREIIKIRKSNIPHSILTPTIVKNMIESVKK